MAVVSDTLERRGTAEIRAAGPGRLQGYAAVYGSWSQDLGGFIERVMPGAFDESLRSPGAIQALWDHDGRHVLGRVGAGTLDLLSDSRGLEFRIDLPPTTAGKDLAVLVGRGDIAGASFAFRVRPGGETWDRRPAALQRRTLTNVDLSEITITGQPAYTDTTVAKRRIEAATLRRRRRLPRALYLETCR